MPLDLEPVEERLDLQPVAEHLDLQPVEGTPVSASQKRGSFQPLDIGEQIRSAYSFTTDPAETFKPFPAAERALERLIPSPEAETEAMRLTGVKHEPGVAETVALKAKGALGVMASPGGVALAAAGVLAPEIVGPLMAVQGGQQVGQGVGEIAHGETAAGVSDVALGGLMVTPVVEKVGSLGKLGVQHETILPRASETFKADVKSEAQGASQLEGVLNAGKEQSAATPVRDVLRGDEGGTGETRGVPQGVNESSEGVRGNQDEGFAKAEAEVTSPSANAPQVSETISRQAPTPESEVSSNRGTGDLMREGPGARTLNSSESTEGTGLKNAISELERTAYGFADRPPVEKEEMAASWERAKSASGLEGLRLARALEADPQRGLSSDESAVLLKHKVDLENALNNAAERTISEKDPAKHLEAVREADQLRGELERFLGAVEKRGTAWGREGRWRQALAFEDYSFATQERLLRAARGGEALSDAERAKLQADVAAHRAKAAELETHLQAERARAAAAEAALPPPHIMRVVSQIRERVKAGADESRRFLAGAQFTLSPEVLYHLTRVAADNFLELGENFGRWSSKMVEEIGEKVRPHLALLWEAAHKAVDKAAQGMKESAEVKRGLRAAARTKVVDAEKAARQAAHDAVVKSATRIADIDRKSLAIEAQRQQEIAGIEQEQMARIKGLTDEIARRNAAKMARESVQEVTKRAETSQAEIAAQRKAEEQALKTAHKASVERASQAVKTEQRQQEIELEKRREVADIAQEREAAVRKATSAAARQRALATAKAAAKEADLRAQRARDVADIQRKAEQRVLDLTNRLAKEALKPQERRQGRINRKMEELLNRMGKGDYFGKREVRAPMEPNAKTLQLQKELKELEQTFQERRIQAERRNRTWMEKAQDTVVDWARSVKLLSPYVFPKLLIAGITRVATNPLYRLAGQPLRAIPGLTEKAPVELKINARAEVRAVTSLLKSVPQAWGKLVRGKSNLDVLEGRLTRSREMSGLVGNAHGLVKEPVRQGAFGRSIEIRTRQAAELGMDPSEPAVATSILDSSLADARREIFLNDNLLTKYLVRLPIQALRQSGVTGAKTIANVMEFLTPIVNVPTNIAIAGARLNPIVGFGEAFLRLAKAAKEGELADRADKLSEADAESIARAFKYGTIGTFLAAYAWMNPEQFGGVYDEKGKHRELKPGQMSIMGVATPTWAGHAPEIGFLNQVAAARRVYDRYYMSNGPEDAAISALAFSLLAPVKNLPFVDNYLRLLNTYHSPSQTAGQVVRDATIPTGGVAKLLDSEERAPKTFWQELEMGIPGLRQEVPVKQPVHRSHH